MRTWGGVGPPAPDRSVSGGCSGDKRTASQCCAVETERSFKSARGVESDWTMDISDIALPDFIEVDADKRLGKIRSIFDRENPKGLIVTNDGSYVGVIGEKQLVKSHVEDNTKAAALVRSAPKIDRHED